MYLVLKHSAVSWHELNLLGKIEQETKEISDGTIMFHITKLSLFLTECRFRLIYSNSLLSTDFHRSLVQRVFIQPRLCCSAIYKLSYYRNFYCYSIFTITY